MRASTKGKPRRHSAESRPSGDSPSGSSRHKAAPTRQQPRNAPDAARPPTTDILERISDAFVALDTDWRYTYVNEKAAQIFGRRREELVGKHIWTEFPEGIGQPFYKAYYKAVETQKPIYLEEYYPPYDRWFENRIYPSRDGLTIFFQDVTDRKRTERELYNKNRALTTLRACNQALVRMTDEMDLLTEIGRICVEIGGYRMAWVGYAERDKQRTIRPVAEKGFQSGLLQSLGLTWADTERGREPTGKAIRTRQPVVTRNVPENPDCALWRATAIETGFTAILALPLIAEGELLGALCIHADEPDPFQVNEVALLEELAGDLAYGIVARRARVERAVAEDQLRLSEERLARLVKTVPDGILIFDRRGQITFANPAAERMLGLPLNVILGRAFNDPGWSIAALDGSPISDQDLPFQQALQSDQPSYGSELAIEHADGRRMILSINASPLHDAQENLVGVVAALTDVTERKRLTDALEERNRRLLQAQRMARISFLDWNTKTDRLFVSDDVYRLYGPLRRAELTLPEFLAQVVHPDDLDLVRTRLERAARGAEPLDMDLRVVRPNGEIQWVHAQAELIPDERGDRVTLLGTVANITERKQAEEAIIQSEKRFSQVFHASPVATSITGLKDGRYIDANEAWQDLFGYKREEILASSSLGLNIWVHPEEREGMIRQLEAAGSLRNFEHLARTKAGDVRDVLVSAEVIELNNERYNLSLVIDITERKRVVQALAASEERLSLVFDTVGDVLFLIAVEGDDIFRFVSVNPAFLAVTGLSPEQVLGKRTEEVLPASAHALVLGKYRQAIRENKTVRWEEVSEYPTGTLYGGVAVTPAWDERGICTHLIGSVHDITEIRRAEEQVRKLNVELEARVVERTAQLQTANKDLEAFSYSVSHDLRAPLRAISGFAEIVARRHRPNLNAEGQHYVDNIVQASERMGRLIDDLLTFSRLGRQAVRHEPVPLLVVFDPLRRDCAAQLAEIHGILEIADDLPTVMGDRTLLNQIFANLLENAITYRRKKVPVRVTVTSQSLDGDVVIRVRDNGIGIPSEYYEKIFNIFQRLHSEEEYPGTGIGLATVKKSVELLGGQVWVESVEQEGSTFAVRLPRSS